VLSGPDFMSMFSGECSATKPRSVTSSTTLYCDTSNLSGTSLPDYSVSSGSQAPFPGSSSSQAELQLTAIQAFLQDSLHQVRSMPIESSNEEQLRLIQAQLYDNMKLIRTMHPHIAQKLIGPCQQVQQLIDHLSHLLQFAQQTQPIHVALFSCSPSNDPFPSYSTVCEDSQNQGLTAPGHQFLVLRAIVGHFRSPVGSRTRRT